MAKYGALRLFSIFGRRCHAGTIRWCPLFATVLKKSGRMCVGSFFRPRNESPCAVLIKLKLRTRLREVNVADHGKTPIVQYEPLIVEPGCYRRVVLIGLLVPDDNKLDGVRRYSGFKQRDILHNSVIFAITSSGPQSLEW